MGMVTKPSVEPVRVPLMPPQATLRAFVLHFFVALISLLVFGYLAYLLCWWLQPVDFDVWRLHTWIWLSPPPFHSAAIRDMFFRFIQITGSAALHFGLLITVAVWIGVLRRHRDFVRLRDYKLPGFIVAGITAVVLLCTLILMIPAGRTQLGLSAREGFLNRARFLLWLGADPDAGDTSPFVLAVHNDHYDLAALLLNHKRLSKEQANSLLLFVAISSQSWIQEKMGWRRHVPDMAGIRRLVDILIEAGADSNYIIDNNNRRPLQYAASQSNLEAVQILLEYGAILDASGYLGRTALHDAAFTGCDKIASFLLEHGANPNAKDIMGLTPS